MSESKPSELTLREPAADEMERISHLFGDASLPAGTQIFAAVRQHPIERFVAAVACRSEANIMRFRVARRPGVPASVVAGPLLQRAETHTRASGINAMQYAELVPAENPLAAILCENGFVRLRSERYFETPVMETWNRIMGIYARQQRRLPPTWRTESIRQHSPEVAWSLIAPHRLVPPEELRDYWRVNAANGFDLDWSSLLFDGGQVVGTLLARRVSGVFCVDVLVVDIANARRRSLGEMCLLHHAAKQCDPHAPPVRCLRFRAGEVEHRQTANLAFRMGGHELPPHHAFIKHL